MCHKRGSVPYRLRSKLYVYACISGRATTYGPYRGAALGCERRSEDRGGALSHAAVSQGLTEPLKASQRLTGLLLVGLFLCAFFSCSKAAFLHGGD